MIRRYLHQRRRQGGRSPRHCFRLHLARLARLLLLIGSITILLLSLVSLSIAQENARSPVVIDGQELFQVGNSEAFSAAERAEIINNQLQAAVAAREAVDVDVLTRNNSPTILLDDRHLLTVTGADVPLGKTRIEQALDWTRQIERAIEQAQRERTRAYLQQAGLLTLGILAIAACIHWAIGQLWRYTLRPAIQTLIPSAETNEPEVNEVNLLRILVRILLTLIRVGIWLGAALYITNLFPASRQFSYRITDILINSLTAPLFTLGESEYSVVALIILAIMLFAIIIGSRMITEVIKLRVLRFTGVNRGAQEAVAILIRYTLIFLSTLVLLQLWGLDISSLAILASALGVGIGFGLQNIAKDFGSGLVLVFERPIQVGDFIELQDFQGIVERIGARSTLVRTLDQISIIVPNSRFLETEVINWSHSNPISRIHLPVGVAYGSDVEAVRSALLDAAKEHPRVLSTPAPQVFFKGFGDSSLDFELLVWTAEPSKHLILRSDLYFRIEAEFRRHEVEIPFPQRDVHVRTGSLPIELSPQFQQVLQDWLERSANGKHHSDR